MPLWIYTLPPKLLATLMIVVSVSVSLVGLWLTRKLILPRLNLCEGTNNAVSGSVQAIGVFYGITVGLLAVGVWNTYTNASDIVAREASDIGSLYRDVTGLPEPVRGELRKTLREYTQSIIAEDWPLQRQGQRGHHTSKAMNHLAHVLMRFEPGSEGERDRYLETLGAFNRLTQQRRLRVDAAGAGLSELMWWVIWLGAAISISVAYFFHLEDGRVHAILVALTAGFLALVIFMIAINDKPFYGTVCVSSDSYQIVIDTLMNDEEGS